MVVIFGGLLVVLLSLVEGSTASQPLNDTYYMQLLVDAAKADSASLPFHAMVVRTDTGEIMCQEANPGGSPLTHGEMVTIQACYDKFGPSFQFPETTLYTTAESCPMCMSGAAWAKIGRVVFGTSIEFLVSSGWNQIEIPSQEVADKTNFWTIQLTGGVLSVETDKLFAAGPPDWLGGENAVARSRVANLKHKHPLFRLGVAAVVVLALFVTGCFGQV
eukprot:gb/GEZN01009345.1/.p1 GENE.gb/GEZN01009345.1/~~gb/GEZN01009345.1/.p1  ORF type:complete len:218 (+),score=22.10 gb/GEZN01009345.1/:78-731(+)